MMQRARDAGAMPAAGALRRLLLLLCGALAVTGARAADLQLLHADAGVVRASPAGDAQQLQLRVETPAGVHTLRLRRHATLGAVARGSDAEAFTGEVIGHAGSWVSVTRIGSRWSGLWFDGSEFFGIESAGALAAAQRKALPSRPLQPMVFRLRDVVWEEASFEGDLRHAPPGNGQRMAQALASAMTPDMAAATAGPTHRLKLAIVADSALAARDGGELEANLLARLNVIDGLFSNQVGVEVTADSVTLFTQRRSDPFTDTDEPSGLLDELSAWRASNAWQRQTALTHLFTGRDLERRTVGLAYLDTLCNRRFSASLSEARGPATFAALIAAHEIAHVFGAPHDGEEGGACATTTGNQFLMAPRINGSQQFSACSLAQMAPRVQAASCLQKLSPEGVVQPPVSPVTGGDGGGGGLAGHALAWLGLMALAGARRRLRQMRANQSAR